jgi:hypothetical protein
VTATPAPSDSAGNSPGNGPPSPVAGGSSGDGEPPWLLLLLVALVWIASLVGAALFGRRYLRPSSAR